MARLRVQTQTTTASRPNLPGQDELRFKTGTYADFVTRMRDAIHQIAVLEPGGQWRKPLAQLDTRFSDRNEINRDDFGVALIQAWAVVCDVLSFYNERIINEHYVRTAVEHRSVRELIHMLGYSSSPGLAASAHLAFELYDTKNSPSKINIPKEIRIESTPGQDEEPQIFTTDGEIQARVEWNKLAPYTPQEMTVAPLFTDAGQVKIEGVRTRINPGDFLLIRGQLSDLSAYSVVHTLSDIKTDPRDGATVLNWEPPEDDAPPQRILHPKLATFQTTAQLFGASAPQWEDMPDVVREQYRPRDGGLYLGDGKQWRNINRTLPPSPIRTVATLGTQLFAAVQGSGLYRSRDRGASWVPVTAGLAAIDLISLHRDARQTLYAGTADGNIFRSRDGGDTWSSIQGGLSLRGDAMKDEKLPETAVLSFVDFNGPPPKSTFTKEVDRFFTFDTLKNSLNPKIYAKLTARLGKTAAEFVSKIVTAFAKRIASVAGARVSYKVVPKDRFQRYLMVGTESGVYRAGSAENGWAADNEGLPETDVESGASRTAVNAFAIYQNRIFAATDRGVFAREAPGLAWRAFNNGLPESEGEDDILDMSVHDLYFDETGEGLLLAATDHGVFARTVKEKAWRSMNGGLPGRVQGRIWPNLKVTKMRGVRQDGALALFIATTNGLYRSLDRGGTWSLINQSLTLLDFKCDDQFSSELDRGLISPALRLAFSDQGRHLSHFVIAQTLKQGEAWRVIDENAIEAYDLIKEGPALIVYRRAANMSGLAIDELGTLLVSTDWGQYTEDQWPNFHIQQGHIDLARRHPEVISKSLVLLTQEDRQLVCEVNSVGVIHRRDYEQTAIISRLKVDDHPDLIHFDLRSTRVEIASQDLALYRIRRPKKDPVKGDHLIIKGLHPALPEGRTLIITGKRTRARLGRLGGVRLLENDQWRLLGLGDMDIHCLAIDHQYRLHAGLNNGIYRLDQGVWRRIGLEDQRILSLVTNLELGEIYASTTAKDEGTRLYRYRKDRWLPIRTPFPVGKPLLYEPVSTNLYLAAVDQGIWCSENSGDTWREISTGLRNAPITALTADPESGDLYAAVKGYGVYHRENIQHSRWRLMNATPRNGAYHRALDHNLLKLICHSHEGLYAISKGRVIHRSFDDDKGWRPIYEPEEPLTDLYLHVTQAKDRESKTASSTFDLYVSTRGGGVHRLRNGAWRPLSLGLTNHIQALIHHDRLGMIAGGSGETVLGDPNSTHLVLRHHHLFSITPPFRLEQESFLEPLQSAFADHGVVLSKKAKLDLKRDADGAYVVRDEDQQIFLIYREREALHVFQPHPKLTITHSPLNEDGDLIRWDLEDELGVKGRLWAYAHEVREEYSLEDDITVGETLLLDQVTPIPETNCTRLGFVRPMTKHYDVNTVVLHGNVVTATHGKPIKETLGSGDSGMGNQQFRLRQGPLTYLQGEDGPEDTLTIRVNPTQTNTGVVWSPQQTLHRLPANARNYILRRDGENRPTLTFGDGREGARLPTGKENITAEYRIGIGKDGEVGADSINQLLDQPLGVRRVTNPLPAGGAADPESLKSAKRRAPVMARSLKRILSQHDHEDYLALYPGVAKATARAIRLPRGQVCHVTIALQNGEILDKESRYYQDMIAAVKRVKSRASGEVIIDSYEARFFDVTARIQFERGAKEGSVIANVRRLLLETYTFEKRGFGDDVVASDLLRLIQTQDGVQSVVLERLHIQGEEATLRQTITARKARWQRIRRVIEPAEIILINPEAVRLAPME